MIGRRVFVAAMAGGVGGCGFAPLYGKHGATGGAVAPQLASIFVKVMPERNGQLLRQALQQRLAGADDSGAKLYELSGSLNVAAEAIGIQQDTSSTRTRLNASTNWTLRKVDLANTLVTSGSARATDGVNVNNQEYFALDLETSAAYQRLAETVADQIAQDLAIYFRTHPAPA